MLERLSAPGTAAVSSAQNEARDLGHDSITSEDLLLGLLGQADGIAAELLSEFRVTATMVLGGMLAAPIMETSAPPPNSGGLPFTEEARMALEFANRESHRREDHYVGTGHLLLGIVQDGSPLEERLLVRGVEVVSLRSRVDSAISERSELPVVLAQVKAEVQRFPELTRDEEVELARVVSSGAEAFRARLAGDAENQAQVDQTLSMLEEARDRAVARLLQGGRRLALSVAEEYARQGHDPVYVYYEGVSALATSVVTPRWELNWREGERFSSYATTRMKEAVNELLKR